ncbi:MAG: hypothetical protein GWN37_14430, partial [Gammaproteobacteria bacterium]|nr:hypothetical protein [Gammaproteobacteria bacterium]
RATIWQPLAEALEKVRRDYLTTVSQTTNPNDARTRLQNQTSLALRDAFEGLLVALEPEEIIEGLLTRVDELLATA